MILQRDAQGHVTFSDVNGKSYVLRTADDYVRAAQSVLDDPTLPEVEKVSEKQVQVETVLKKTLQELVPRPFQPLADFGFQRLQIGMKKIGTPRRVSTKKNSFVRRGRR